MKYDWDRIIKDEVLCEFWDNDDDKTLGIMFGLEQSDFCFLSAELYKGEKKIEERWVNCEPYHTKDKEKYAIKESNMKYDWDRIIKDEVLCLFMDNGSIAVGFLKKVEINDDCLNFIFSPYRNSKWHDLNDADECEPYHEWDKEKYVIEEPKYRACEKYVIKEPEYRPCESYEEFRKFMYKTAKPKIGDIHVRVITEVFFDIDKEFQRTNNAKWWFENWELFEPIDGSTVIGVKV